MDLASVWFSESGWHANAHNPHGDASGICQMMPATLAGLGFVGGWEAFVRTPLEDQIQPWCTRYYRTYTNRMTSGALAYLATFLPAYLDADYRRRNGVGDLTPDTVVAAKMGRLGWAYTANAVFDVDFNGQITLSELDLAIRRNCLGARWEALSESLARVAVIPPPMPQTLPDAIDLTTTLGVQRALGLTADGARGPLTIAAIRSFQSAHNLTPDGLVGPLTRGALRAALSAPV